MGVTKRIETKDVLYGVDAEAAALCEELGIDPSRCRRLILDISSEKLALAYAEMYVSSSSIPNIRRLLHVRQPVVEVVELPGE